MQRHVDVNGQLLVWCRKRSGYTKVRVESRILRKCHHATEPREIHIMIEIIKKLKEGEVSGGGGWKAEGDKQDVKNIPNIM